MNLALEASLHLARRFPSPEPAIDDYSDYIPAVPAENYEGFRMHMQDRKRVYAMCNPNDDDETARAKDKEFKRYRFTYKRNPQYWFDEEQRWFTPEEEDFSWLLQTADIHYMDTNVYMSGSATDDHPCYKCHKFKFEHEIRRTEAYYGARDQECCVGLTYHCWRNRYTQKWVYHPEEGRHPLFEKA